MRQPDKSASKKPRPHDDDEIEDEDLDVLEDEDEDDEVPQTGLMAWISREMVWFDGFLMRWLVRIILVGSHVSIGILACYLIVWHTGRGLIYDNVDEIPPRFVGLVLGCPKMVGKYENRHFTTRMEAAAELYREQKLQYLIVSGKSDDEDYSEAYDMKEALIARGVPANHIYCDNAGYRTLDSVIRAHKVFRQDECTIISQYYPNTRAVYIARRYGMEGCIAYNAEDRGSEWTIKVIFREIFVRIMTVLDVEFFKTMPEKIGEEVLISEKTPPRDE